MIVTFLVFALTFILFLLGVLFYLAPVSCSSEFRCVSTHFCLFFQKSKNVTTVPGLDPLDDITGNIDDITSAGSFHEFLVDLHEKFGPIASFWYGPKYCISVGSATAFKDIQHLTDRPGNVVPKIGLHESVTSARQYIPFHILMFSEYSSFIN